VIVISHLTGSTDSGSEGGAWLTGHMCRVEQKGQEDVAIVEEPLRVRRAVSISGSPLWSVSGSVKPNKFFMTEHSIACVCRDREPRPLLFPVQMMGWQDGTESCFQAYLCPSEL
jgi:hypothetical protein